MTGVRSVEVGKAFAYFAWMRCAEGYRREGAERGLTFFLLFESLQPPTRSRYVPGIPVTREDVDFYLGT